MLFLKSDPPRHLAHLVRQFWIVENPDPVPCMQKIVPDGFGEIILHYGDPYRIRLYDDWEIQDRILLSGQIRRYFFLENTGISAMLGIKLMPSATYALFGRDTSPLTDKVVPLQSFTGNLPPALLLESQLKPEDRMYIAGKWIESIMPAFDGEGTRTAQIVTDIIDRKGLVDIASLASSYHISRRHLEREFKRAVGLSPKYFSRIIQFNYIFEAIRARDNRWVEVALNSGYFDQSHFIKNFKEFTGEAPSQYGFDEMNMANFFLKR